MSGRDAVLTIALAVIGCDDSVGSSGGDGGGAGKDVVDTRPPLVCIANVTYGCECSPGVAGRQRCIDGFTFDACACDPAEVIDDLSAPDAEVFIADTSPAETTPADTTPIDTAEVADTTPADTIPADTTPADTEPADTTPADTTPIDTEPVDTTPAETTPAETTPTDIVNTDAFTDCSPVGPFGGHVYYVCLGGMSYTLAANFCASGGGTLVRGDSATVLFQLAQTLPFNEAWVGAKKVGGVWQWDGVDVTPSWCPGQPDGVFLHGPAECALFNKLGCLDDAPCETIGATVVCEL